MRWEEMEQCHDLDATLRGTPVMGAGSNRRAKVEDELDRLVSIDRK
jgi:hypothetical protein